MRLWNIPIVPRDDTLGHYRDLIFYWFAIGGTLTLGPFVAYAFYQGNLVLGLAALCIVLVFVMDAAFLQRGKPPPLPPIVAFVPIIAALGIGIVTTGTVTVFWAYPALLLFQFVLSRGTANTLNLLLILVVSALAYRHLGTAIAARVAATLLLTLLFANVFMRIVLELQRRLQNQAIVDPLTGIHNRRHFEAVLDHEIAMLARSDKPCSLLLMDIDRFKPINDELGHATGDRVLIKVAEIIRDSIRQTDQLFRIGGEEFVALLPDTGHETAGIVSEKIRAAVAVAPVLADRKVTISIGLDELRPGDDRGALLSRCDVALYKAKERGRNRVEYAVRPALVPSAGQGLAG